MSKEEKDTAILVRPIEILDGVAYIPLKASHVIKTIIVEEKSGKYKVYTCDTHGKN